MTRLRRVRLGAAKALLRASTAVGRLGPLGRWIGDRFVMASLGSLAPDYYTPWYARELPAINNALQLLGGELAALPRVVEERLGDRWEEVSDIDPEHLLVTQSWEAWRTASQSFRQIMESVLLYGFAAVYVVRDAGFQARELVLLDPARVTRSGEYGNVKIQYGGPALEGIPTDLAANRENLVWIEHLAPLDRSSPPMSVFQHAWPTIRAGIAVQRFNAWFYDRGALPGLFLVNEEAYSADDLKKLQKTFNKGMDNMRAQGRREFILPKGWKPEVVAPNPRESQVDMRLREATTAVAQLTGISPVLLADLEKSTYSNYQQALRAFVRFTLSTWADVVSTQISRTLWPSGRRRLRLEVQDPGDESRLETAQRVQTLINAGVWTQNDGREATGKDRVEEGDPNYNPSYDTLARTPTLPIPEILTGVDVNGPDLGDANGNIPAPPGEEEPEVVDELG